MFKRRAPNYILIRTSRHQKAETKASFAKLAKNAEEILILKPAIRPLFATFARTYSCHCEKD